jgi:hypothetical protein
VFHMLLYFSFIFITSCLYVSEIAGRMIHVVKIMSTIFFCTEEVVKYFTYFSGCHVVLMILDARSVKISFCEIELKYSRAIFDDLDT